MRYDGKVKRGFGRCRAKWSFPVENRASRDSENDSRQNDRIDLKRAFTECASNVQLGLSHLEIIRL